MNDRFRRHGVGDIYHQDATRTSSRSHYRRPPSGPRQLTVPAWEKQFCSEVGGIPWRRILDAKKETSFHENVLKWNDSAGQQAFDNAKNRFWAKMNGLPCNISLPDRDMYIDEIDWNCVIDPELLLDLEQEQLPFNKDDKKGKSKLVGDSLFLSQPVLYSGWDDAKEIPGGTVDDLLDSGLHACVRNVNNAVSPWERECDRGNNALENSKHGDSRGTSWERNQWEKNKNDWENPEPNNCANWGTWDENYRKRDASSQYMSRYKTNRSQGDYCQTDNRWMRGQGRKRVNLSYELPRVDKKPFASQHWNSINSCNGSRETGNPRSWEKRVSL